MQLPDNRILFLADINSAHTRKWCLALEEKGLRTGIFSLQSPQSNWYKEKGILAFFPKNQKKSQLFSKLGYILQVPLIRQAIREFKPDILHAHYATSYGLIGALTGFHPFVISAWGSDVMSFPEKSIFHKQLLKFNLNKADQVFVTSDAIEKAINDVGTYNIKKIPFGVDTDYFKQKEIKSIFPAEVTVVGSVKSLETIYGIDILINAFKKVCNDNPEKSLKLLIVGGGSKEVEYKDMVKKAGIDDKVVFTGKVDYSEVINYHNMIDIFVNVSRNESFGVSVLEASACENAVIASDIGGLKEVVIQDQTGLLVEPENVNATAEAIEKLLAPEKRMSIGKAGRTFVQSRYDFAENLKDLISAYNKLLNK